MSENDSIFLSLDEAREAVCRDFRQYAPQVMLFSEIVRVLSHTGLVSKRQPGKHGLWINRPGKRNMRWFEGAALVDVMCDIVADIPADPQLMAAICARVFQTRAVSERDPAGEETGVRVLTAMEGFHCRQCGQCCRTLDYRRELSSDDVSRWQRMERTDILDWVGQYHKQNQPTVYRMWMKPGTREFAETCPFLHKKPDKSLWLCRIHDVKPWICRQYPVSRKHALMTGCPGFLPHSKTG